MKNASSLAVNEKGRDLWFDNIKGFLIICVVVGHMVGSAAAKYPTMAFLYNFIYTFHMAAFAMVSGYFMKRRVAQKDYASFINKMLVPYLCAQVFVYLIRFIVPTSVKTLSLDNVSTGTSFSFLFPLYQLWYFAAMMFAFLFCVWVKADKKPLRAFILSLLLSVVSGCFTYAQIFKLSKSLSVLPFFVIGFICTSDFAAKLRTRKLLIIPSVLIIGGAACCMWALRHEESPVSIFAFTSRLYSFAFDLPFKYAVLVWLATVFAGILIGASFFVICPRRKTPLAVLGEKSNYIFVLHALPVAIAKDIFLNPDYSFELDTPLSKAIYLLICVAICYLLVSKPVTALTRPIIEPKFDIRKIGEYLKIK